jgi:hypothetical protein
MLSCSRQAGTLDQGVTPTSIAGISQQLPDISVLRSSSVLIGFSQSGIEALYRDADALDEGSSLRLPAPGGSTSWGVWGFNNGLLGASDCLVEFNGDSGAQAYFAIANFVTGRWEAGGPLGGPQQTFAIGDPAYLSPLGNLYVAVIAWDAASILVDSITLVVDQEPFSRELDNSGGWTSLAMVNSKPAISYYDDSTDDLKFVRATDLFGSSWGTPQILDETGDTGLYTSLHVVNGKPAIAYHDFTEKDLRFIIAQDENGTAWNSPITVDGSVSGTGEWCSLNIVANLPAISYYDIDNSELRYARANDPNGETWADPVSVDNSGNTGQESCLSIIGGLAMISYRDGGAGEMRVIRSLDSIGASWEPFVIVASGNNTGFSSSLVEVDGFPALAYYDGTDSALIYQRATNVNGTIWDSAQTLDGAADDSGSYCSMALVGGLPLITFHKGIEGDLRFVQSPDATGISWTAPVLLDDSSVIVGKDGSLADVWGVGGVSYYDQTNGKLRYMWGFGV